MIIKQSEEKIKNKEQQNRQNNSDWNHHNIWQNHKIHILKQKLEKLYLKTFANYVKTMQCVNTLTI